jgi:hypothetical protein
VTDRIDRVAPDELGPAAAGDAEWMWVVGQGIDPRPDALDKLLAAAERAPRTPAAVCSLIVGPSGDPHPDYLPDGQRHQLEETIEASRLRLLPIRDAPLACVLLSRAAVAALDPPDPRFRGEAGREFMGRLLADAPGYMASDSVAAAATGAPAATADRLRLLASPAWSPIEKARLAALALRDARKRR